MSDIKCKPDEFAKALGNVIQQYSDAVVQSLPDAVNAAAKKGLKTLKAEAKKKINGSRYVSSFKNKKTQSTSGITEYTLYSTRYRVAHLLEHGHAIKNQTGKVYGVTSARPHWAPAENTAVKELEDQIQQKVEEAG